MLLWQFLLLPVTLYMIKQQFSGHARSVLVFPFDLLPWPAFGVSAVFVCYQPCRMVCRAAYTCVTYASELRGELHTLVGILKPNLLRIQVVHTLYTLLRCVCMFEQLGCSCVALQDVCYNYDLQDDVMYDQVFHRDYIGT